MSAGYAILISVGACVLAAALEGACAGRNVKAFYAELRFPRYSAPLWVWGVIGGLYYVIFWFVLYRLLRLGGGSALRGVALTLILFMMVVNARDRARLLPRALLLAAAGALYEPRRVHGRPGGVVRLRR